jgi:outer membrane protein OmpA-like peptidoglycan-associated protein
MSRPSIGSTCQEVLMKWNLAAALVTVLVVEMHAAPPADACGVKLTVKSSAPRKAVAHTSNPSDVLLLGNPPRRLELDLTAAGHRVEVAPAASAAKRKSYAVVITDGNLQDEARSSFPGAIVIVRSGEVTADMRSVEQQVARRPVRTEEARTPVAVRPVRAPIAAGPPQPEPRKIVAASEPKDSQPVADPTPPPERAAATPPRPTPPPERAPATPPRPTPPPERVAATAPRPAEVTPTPERPKVVAKANAVHDEVYFTLGSFKLDNQTALARAARWLKDSSDVHVVIEGHADPTGTHEGNMVLSQKRAESVRDFLVSAGIEESRLEVMAYGDTRLRYGRADRRNRRAAVVVK